MKTTENSQRTQTLQICSWSYVTDSIYIKMPMISMSFFSKYIVRLDCHLNVLRAKSQVYMEAH